MTAVLYRQCRLVKRILEGRSIQISWIPAEFAQTGKVVKIRDDDGVWDDGWVIHEVGNALAADALMTSDAIPHRLQREAMDR